MLRKEGGDREMVDVLSLVLQHNEEDVLCAVELALDALTLQTTPEVNVARFPA